MEEGHEGSACMVGPWKIHTTWWYYWRIVQYSGYCRKRSEFKHLEYYPIRTHIFRVYFPEIKSKECLVKLNSKTSCIHIFSKVLEGKIFC